MSEKEKIMQKVQSEMTEGIVLRHGNYQKLESYRSCMVIFDATNDFCSLFLKAGDRTIDQMIQAARSGKQNIVEGSVDSQTSLETEIRLFGVARGSLAELLNDYQDFLRTHNLSLWSKDDSRIQEIRQFVRANPKDYPLYKDHFKLGKNTPELFCNLMITMIHQTDYLLGRHLEALEQKFVNAGGMRERMTHARLEHRNAQKEEALSDLREIYRELAKMNRQDLMKKVEQVAAVLKGEVK